MSCMGWFDTLAQYASTSLDLSGRIRLTTAPGPASPVDILALGSGWTWSFLGPAAGERGYRTAFTTRDGHGDSIPFTFDPSSDSTTAFEALPDAQTIVVIFPLYTAEAARRLIRGYIATRSESVACSDAKSAYSMNVSEEKALKGSVVQTSRTRFILLGSTGIWKHGGPTLSVQTAPLYPSSSSNDQVAYVEDNLRHKHNPPPSPPHDAPSPWYDRHSPIDKVPRALAEEAFLAFNKAEHDAVSTSVLCLSGLWGHGRSPRRYVNAIAPTKEQLSALGSIHFVHGHDVARALLAMHEQWDKASAQRWLLTNERVYDLWDLVSQWGNAGEAGRQHVPQGPQPGWVQELVAESRSSSTGQSRRVVRSLPRTVEQLDYALDSSDFWNTFELHPEVPWVD